MADRLFAPYLQRAVVVINGSEYHEWTSVSVRLAVNEVPLNSFRFTCSEQIPFASKQAALQIKPGDKCNVYLDGYLAIKGWVTTRQVYYDAHQHNIEIQGEGDTGPASRAAFVSKTGNATNQDVEQICKMAMTPLGIKVQTEGQINRYKFPRVASFQGESCKDFVERYMRATDTSAKESNEGAFVLLGTSIGATVDTVIEGVNIISGREVIHLP